jgi:uncharacterized protein (DUF433 family)
LYPFAVPLPVILSTFSPRNGTTCIAIERAADRVSGAWVFRGTRVPVSALFENIEGGASVREFLEWFPGVTEQQASAALEHATRSLGLA